MLWIIILIKYRVSHISLGMCLRVWFISNQWRKLLKIEDLNINYLNSNPICFVKNNLRYKAYLKLNDLYPKQLGCHLKNAKLHISVLVQILLFNTPEWYQNLPFFPFCNSLWRCSVTFGKPCIWDLALIYCSSFTLLYLHEWCC